MASCSGYSRTPLFERWPKCLLAALSPGCEASNSPLSLVKDAIRKAEPQTQSSMCITLFEPVMTLGLKFLSLSYVPRKRLFKAGYTFSRQKNENWSLIAIIGPVSGQFRLSFSEPKAKTCNKEQLLRPNLKHHV